MITEDNVKVTELKKAFSESRYISDGETYIRRSQYDNIIINQGSDTIILSNREFDELVIMKNRMMRD
jgi:hypothetical protein